MSYFCKYVTFSVIAKDKLLRNTVLCLLTLLLTISFVTNASPSKKRGHLTSYIKISQAQKDFLLEKWGVEMQGVRRTSAGYMLDFRFIVRDVKKAGPLLDRTIKAQMIVEKNGAKLSVPIPPTTGRLRASAKFPKPNQSYFMFFGNPGGYVKTGEKVSVTIGDFKVEHLTVM